MADATFGGHLHLIEFFISKGANDWDWGMAEAAFGGHKELIDFFQQKIQQQNNISTYYPSN